MPPWSAIVTPPPRQRSDLTAAVLRLGRRTPLPLRHTYGNARRHLTRLVFERGVFDTAPRVHLEDFGLGAPDRVAYIPSGWLFLRRALRPRDVTSDDVFIDFGAGMGRIVTWPHGTTRSAG